jgi:hypothetical protein
MRYLALGDFHTPFQAFKAGDSLDASAFDDASANAADYERLGLIAPLEPQIAEPTAPIEPDAAHDAEPEDDHA